MILKTVDGIQYSQFELLADFPKLIHGSFSRKGGNSLKPFYSLNVSFHVGDEKNDVNANHRQIKQILGISELSYAKQAHELGILEVTAPGFIGEGDALVTKTPNHFLLIQHADCQAALFYDPILHLVAAIHAGWRGNVKRIYSHTIEYLKARYGVKPANLLVGVSPSLGPAHSEFKNYQSEFPKALWGFQWKSNYFDLWAMSEAELLAAGVKKDHLEFAKICTYSDTDYFSYRRDKITGRMASVIGLL